uniref:Putative ovule protein n=1 Tax=Solanum chacoense TaxID=4108 RepID=A0A0V0HBN4_SOLCH
MGTGKMRYPPVEEALGLSSTIKKYGSTLINTVSSRVVSIKSIITMTRGIFSKPRAQISNSFCEKSKVQQPLASTGYTKPQNLRIDKNIEHSKKNVQLSKGPGGSTSLEHTSPDDLNKSRMMNSSMTHPCDPSLVPSQKGSSDILGALEFVPGMLISCIKAHPPSRVRCKVYEFSGLFPDTLKFELVPRGDIWESLFNNHISSKEDIGLYFFASEKERLASALYIYP